MSPYPRPHRHRPDRRQRFFVAAEFALVKIRPTRLEQLAKEGRRQARLLAA